MAKGSMLDIIFIPILLAVIGLSVIVASTVLDAIAPKMPLSGQTAMVSGQEALAVFDYTIVIIGISLALGSIGLAFLYPSQPIFIIAGIMTLIVAMIIVPQVSNIYQQSIAKDTLSATALNFPLISWMLGDDLPIFSLVVGVFILIVSYIGWQRFTQSQGTI